MTAPNDHDLALHETLERVRHHLPGPGIVVGVGDDVGRVRVAAAGSHQPQQMTPLQSNHRFRIGSLTKTFTAALVLQLIEKRSLSLEDSLARWFPAVPFASQITVAHLLQHTSGLFNYTESPQFLELAMQGKRWSADDLIAFAAAEKQYAEPGEAWHYSNTNYILLGKIIEAVTSRPLAQVYEGALFGPLGLQHTTLELDDDPRVNLVPGYGYMPGANGMPMVQDMTGIMAPSAAWSAGALISTAADVLAFSRALFAHRVIAPETFALMQRCVPMSDLLFPFVTGYGFGLLEFELSGLKGIGHLGNTPGYSSLMAYFPRIGQHVVVLTNFNYDRLQDGSVNVQHILQHVLELLKRE